MRAFLNIIVAQREYFSPVRNFFSFLAAKRLKTYLCGSGVWNITNGTVRNLGCMHATVG